MTRTTQHSWLNRFAWFTAIATFFLLGLGGLVTSKGVGMAVPDWPTTYGYNMFLFPIHLWTGGIFYEHTHRLFASFVGLLTTILAVWLWLRESRAWLRWAGLAAFVAVVLQGVLGGLRVTLYKDEIGILHGALAQLFFILVCLIALFASGWGDKLRRIAERQPSSAALRGLVVGTTLLIFAQLILGAMMRHQHAGLAIPDFPLAYGRFWPPMDAAFVEKANQQRLELYGFNPITAFQIGLHMAHRLSAVLILLLIAVVSWRTRRESGNKALVTRLAYGWLGVVCLQAGLGAATVLTNKAADVATAHVLVGALSLLLGVVLSAVGLYSPSRRPEDAASARRGDLAPGSSLWRHKDAATAV